MFPLQLELDKEGISFVQVSPSISNVHQSSVNSHTNFLHFYPKSFKQRGTIRRHRLRGQHQSKSLEESIFDEHRESGWPGGQSALVQESDKIGWEWSAYITKKERRHMGKSEESRFLSTLSLKSMYHQFKKVKVYTSNLTLFVSITPENHILYTCSFVERFRQAFQ